MTGFERWESLMLFIVWGLICYIWGYSEREPKRNKYSYQPKLPTKKPNGIASPPPPTPFSNYNGPPPEGMVKPPAPPGPPPPTYSSIWPNRRDN